MLGPWSKAQLPPRCLLRARGELQVGTHDLDVEVHETELLDLGEAVHAAEVQELDGALGRRLRVPAQVRAVERESAPAVLFELFERPVQPRGATGCPIPGEDHAGE